MLDTKHKISNRQYSQRGQSLIEILIALALGVVLIGGSVTLMSVSLRGYRSFKNHLQAIISTRQAMEITQAIIRANWHSISDLTPGIHYKIAKRGNSYTFQKGEEKVFDDTNLVAYWNMDESSGQIAYDNKNTNNGILINSPTWKSGSDCVSSSCLEFNGSSNYVNIPSSSNLEIADTITVECWVYYKSGNGRIVQKDDRGSSVYTRLWELGGYGGNFRMELWHSNGASTVQTANPLTVNGWMHLAMTFNGTDIKMYQDGVLTKTYNFPGDIRSDSGTPITIGGQWGSTEWFNGSIDEVRIYNTALTVEQISEHYKAGLDKLGLVGYWPMDENGETIAYDNANSNNGTLYNSPTWQASSNCVSGSCLNFDGNDDYISLPAFSNPSSVTDYSISFWFYLNAHNSAGRTYFYDFRGNGSVVDSTAPIFLIDNSGGLGILDAYTGIELKSSAVSVLTQWHHIVVTRTSGTTNIYLDGILVKSGNAGTGGNLGVEKRLGNYAAQNTPGGNYWMNGLIDEVRVYNRALSEQEINNRYQAGYTRYITFNKVSRTSGNINTTYSSNNDDTSTLKAISTVKYGEGLVSEQSGGILSVANYFTRSENSKVFHQTDWLGGSGVTGPVSNPSNEYDASSNITVSTVGQITLTDTQSAGELTSSIFDTGVSSGAGFNNLLWQGSLGTGGTVKFQIAFSNDEDGPWTYYGPTSTSDWYQPNPDISSSFPTVGTASPQNKRYIRYKINLSTSSVTPTINDIIINWTP